jgi:hypothetical protein
MAVSKACPKLRLTAVLAMTFPRQSMKRTPRHLQGIQTGKKSQ